MGTRKWVGEGDGEDGGDGGGEGGAPRRSGAFANSNGGMIGLTGEAAVLGVRLGLI